MKETEVRNIAGMIARILNAKGNPDVIEEVRREVGELTAKFPIYQEH